MATDLEIKPVATAEGPGAPKDGQAAALVAIEKTRYRLNAMLDCQAGFGGAVLPATGTSNGGSAVTGGAQSGGGRSFLRRESSLRTSQCAPGVPARIPRFPALAPGARWQGRLANTPPARPRRRVDRGRRKRAGRKGRPTFPRASRIL